MPTPALKPIGLKPLRKMPKSFLPVELTWFPSPTIISMITESRDMQTPGRLWITPASNGAKKERLSITKKTISASASSVCLCMGITLSQTYKNTFRKLLRKAITRSFIFTAAKKPYTKLKPGRSMPVIL